jgi:hypothetical protein
MATWITHLRVAVQLLVVIPGFDRFPRRVLAVFAANPDFTWEVKKDWHVRGVSIA